eukprot:gene7037-biopygen9028
MRDDTAHSDGPRKSRPDQTRPGRPAGVAAAPPTKAPVQRRDPGAPRERGVYRGRCEQKKNANVFELWGCRRCTFCASPALRSRSGFVFLTPEWHQEGARWGIALNGMMSAEMQTNPGIWDTGLQSYSAFSLSQRRGHDVPFAWPGPGRARCARAGLGRAAFGRRLRRLWASPSAPSAGAFGRRRRRLRPAPSAPSAGAFSALGGFARRRRRQPPAATTADRRAPPPPPT